jgi:hypothetical protein
MARRKQSDMNEANTIREFETVATAEAKGHSDQRFVLRPVEILKNPNKSWSKYLPISLAIPNCWV